MYRFTSGNQENQWLRADISFDLPSTAQDLEMQVVFEAYTAGEYKSDNKGDIAIDEITVTTNGDCQLSSGQNSPPNDFIVFLIVQ